MELQAKPFSIGVRIEHPQAMIDEAQYGTSAGHPRLGAADYKMFFHGPGGRSAYTFCMCPGGLVVAAATEAGGLVTNGMSLYARANANANSALLVGVTPADFGSDHPLAGVEFQRIWERKAFALGGNDYFAPLQLAGDFLADRPSIGSGQDRSDLPSRLAIRPLGRLPSGLCERNPAPGPAFLRQAVAGIRPPRRGPDRDRIAQLVAAAHRAQ